MGRQPGPEEPSSSGATPTSPRLIVVLLARRSLYDQILQAARTRRCATTHGTGLPDDPRRFYINKRLSKVNRCMPMYSGRRVSVDVTLTGNLSRPGTVEPMPVSMRAKILHVIACKRLRI